MRVGWTSIGLLALLGMPVPHAGASDLPPARMVVPKCVVAPVIDGRLTAGEWRDAVAMTAFTRATGPASADTLARRQSVVYVTYDDVQLYVAFSNAVPVVAGTAAFPPLPADDLRLLEAARNACWFAPDAGCQSALRSVFAPDGSVFDARVDAARGTGTPAWDGRWRVATSVTGTYWCVEAAAPLASFGGAPIPDGRVWCAAFAAAGDAAGRWLAGAGDCCGAGHGLLEFRSAAPAFQFLDLATVFSGRAVLHTRVAATSADADVVVTARFGASATFAEEDLVVSRQIRLRPGETQALDLEADLSGVSLPAVRVSDPLSPALGLDRPGGFCELTARATGMGVLYRQVFPFIIDGWTGTSEPADPAADTAPPVACAQTNRQAISALEGEVIAPWTPLAWNGGEVSMWNKRYRLNALGLAEQIANAGRQQLASPMRLLAVVDDRQVEVEAGRGKLRYAADGRMDFDGQARLGELTIAARTRVEADGFVYNTLRLTPRRPTKLQRLSLEIRLPQSAAPLFVTSAGGRYVTYGETPGRWRATEQAPAGLRVASVPFVLLTDSERGLVWFADSTRGWSLDAGKPAQEIENDGRTVTLTVHFVDHADGVLAEPMVLRYGWMATPQKPRHGGWRATVVAGSGAHPMATSLPPLADGACGSGWPADGQFGTFGTLGTHGGVLAQQGMWGVQNVGAYMRPDGGCEAGYNLLGVRDLFLQLRKLGARRAVREPFIWHRASAGLAPYAWMGDVNLADGSVPPLAPTCDVLDAFPASRLRTVGRADQMGAASLMPFDLRFAEGSPEQQTDTRALSGQFVGWMLAHDVVPAGLPAYDRVLLGELEMWDPAIRFVPYWRKSSGVRCEPADVIASAHLWPDRQLVLWVVNTARNATHARLRLDPEALGLKGLEPHWAVDFESGALLPWREWGVELDLPARTWRGVRILLDPRLGGGCAMTATFDAGIEADASLADRWPRGGHANEVGGLPVGKSGCALGLGREMQYSARGLLGVAGSLRCDARFDHATDGILISLPTGVERGREDLPRAREANAGYVLRVAAGALRLEDLAADGAAAVLGATALQPAGGAWRAIELSWKGADASVRLDGREAFRAKLPRPLAVAAADTGLADAAATGGPLLGLGPYPAAAIDNLRVVRQQQAAR